MIAYKLLRVRRDGSLGPLFVDRGLRLKPNFIHIARKDCKHPGLAHRPGFHCCAKPEAPHMKLRLKNGEVRVWCRVQIMCYTKHVRPEAQGGTWFTAKYLQVIERL